MSSTGRVADREEHDTYPTPRWCVRRLLEVLVDLPMGAWGEPCVGDGAIVRAVEEHFTGTKPPWFARQDIRNTSAADHVGDFLTDANPAFADCSVIITNPPFSLAREFIHQARAEAPRAMLVFLLRLNFLGSADRHGWLSRDMPDIYQLPNRPSFVNGKTDSVEYGWFVWGPEPKVEGRIRLLGLTSIEERRRG